MRAILALVAALALGCVGLEEQKLPTYDLALKMGGPERPKLFYAKQIDLHDLPALCPYVIFTGRGGVAKDTIARKIWNQAAEIYADVVIIWDSGTSYVGSVATYWGFGVSTSQPVYQRVLHGVCMRHYPARLGCATDEAGMVIAFTPNSNLPDAGILEGDKILSVNGVVYSRDVQSSMHKMALNWEVGDPVELVWIRPGMGRMKGIATLAANPPAHLELPNSTEWEDPNLSTAEW